MDSSLLTRRSRGPGDCAFLPQPADLVNALLALRSRRAEPRRHPEREHIGPRQVLNRDLSDRRCSVGMPSPQRVLADRAGGAGSATRRSRTPAPAEVAPSATACA